VVHCERGQVQAGGQVAHMPLDVRIVDGALHAGHGVRARVGAHVLGRGGERPFADAQDDGREGRLQDEPIVARLE